MPIKIILFLLVSLAPVYALDQKTTPSNDNVSLYFKIKDTLNLAKSAAFFHVSILYNKFMFGDSFSFNKVVDGNSAYDNKVCQRDANGAITRIFDGKKTPLYLGSIPRNQNDLSKLIGSVSGQNMRVGLYTLNRQFECDWSGLSSLVKSNKSIEQYTYPTTDYSAPHFNDLVRAVYDLEYRDKNDYILAYVHCKAGRGRSAVVIGAYLAHILHAAREEFDIDDIERYLKRCRPQVSLNYEHRAMLTHFIKMLREANSIENLYDQYVKSTLVAS